MHANAAVSPFLLLLLLLLLLLMLLLLLLLMLLLLMANSMKQGVEPVLMFTEYKNDVSLLMDWR